MNSLQRTLVGTTLFSLLAINSYAATGEAEAVTVSDPLRTDVKRINSYEEGMQRIREKQQEDLPISDMTTEVLDRFQDLSASETSEITVKLIREALKSENSLDEFSQLSNYYKSLQTTVNDAASLIKASSQLQKIRDEFNESITKGTVLSQRIDNLELSINEMRASNARVSDAVVMLQNLLRQFANEVVEIKKEVKDVSKQTTSQDQNNTALGDSILKVMDRDVPQKTSSKDLDHFNNSEAMPPFYIAATSVTSSNGVARERASIVGKDGNTFSVEKGYSKGGWVITSIDEGGATVKERSSEREVYLASGEKP